MMRYLLLGILIYLLIMNLTAFIAYGIDKSRAQNARRRTPEKTLIGLAFAGGGIGALAGMLVFHHKTRKLKFCILIPAAILLQIILIIFIAVSLV